VVSLKRKTELTMVKMTISEDKEEMLSTAMNRLLEESNKKPKMSSEMRKFFKSTGMNKSTNPSGQPTIDAVFQQPHSDGHHTHETPQNGYGSCTFFHENNIPDHCVESSSFKLMLNYSRIVGKDYKPPGRRDLGQSLLDINYRNIVEHNKEILYRESDVFGLSWLSDGATIARTPLINVLVIPLVTS